MHLNDLKQRMQEVVLSDRSRYIKSVQLAEIMTALEVRFNVPVFGEERIEKFKKEQPDAWKLYMQASDRRSWDDDEGDVECACGEMFDPEKRSVDGYCSRNCSIKFKLNFRL